MKELLNFFTTVSSTTSILRDASKPNYESQLTPSKAEKRRKPFLSYHGIAKLTWILTFFTSLNTLNIIDKYFVDWVVPFSEKDMETSPIINMLKYYNVVQGFDVTSPYAYAIHVASLLGMAAYSMHWIFFMGFEVVIALTTKFISSHFKKMVAQSTGLWKASLNNV